MINVDTPSFFAIVVVAAVAATTVTVLPKRFAPPVVVLELVLGIVIGPHVLGLAHSDSFIEFFSKLGLGMLFPFVGAWGWVLSVGLLSTLVFPFVGLALRRHEEADRELHLEDDVDAGSPPFGGEPAVRPQPAVYATGRGGSRPTCGST